MNAIHQARLYCLTISLEKRSNDEQAEYFSYIRDDLDAVYQCIEGKRYSHKLLKWAAIERWAMQDWCERQGIPLPEFWFPAGWKIDCVSTNWVEDDELLGHQSGAQPPAITPSPDVQAVEEPASAAPPTETFPRITPPAMSDTEVEGRRKWDQRQRRKIACQEAGKYVWGKHPDWDVKVVANSPEVQDVADGKNSDFDVLLRWLGEVDQRDPAKRRGPKRKK